MAMGIANAMGGSSSGGGGGGLGGMLDKIKEKLEAKKAAAAGGNAVIGDAEKTAKIKTNAAADSMAEGGGGVQPHGDEAHTGGGNVAVAPRKKGIFGGLGGAMGGLFYKMPASGAKYGNSPINKNYGDAKARGFKPAPGKMSTFGVGASNKEKMSGVGSDLLDK
tara:strand:+ start:301 stop:792 length:492 start_codon:yes stop_codon:yes gene_type:complete